MVALPDFVTNAGGVLAVVCAIQGFDEATSQAMVRGAIQANVQRVLARADERGDRPHDAAVALAREQIDGESR